MYTHYKIAVGNISIVPSDQNLSILTTAPVVKGSCVQKILLIILIREVHEPCNRKVVAVE